MTILFGPGAHPRALSSHSFLAVAIAAAMSWTPDGAHAAVTIPGQFEVTDSGAASYTIPIDVPPGTAGMQPALSLHYSSQDGNGILGMGWSLSGLPSIRRCGQTIAQDGTSSAVTYTANDRFCLDGERLIAVAGAYGANGTEYRLEREGFSKIVSYGAAGSGPAWFKAWTKAGQIMEFGNSADSRVEAQGKADARVWAANKISDTKGNYLTVAYAEDNANGDYYPARVDYTGNAGAGTAPYASVRFVYAARPDIVPLYQGGSIIRNTVRLTNIRTYVGETMVRDYRLTFDQSPSTQRSRLTSVVLCDAAGACLPATNVGWQAQSNPTANVAGQYSGWSGYRITSGDWNGDGRSDVMLDGGCYVHLYMADTNGVMVHSGTFTKPSYCSASTYPGDWDGDGKTDIAVFESVSYDACSGSSERGPCPVFYQRIYLYRSTGTSMVLFQTMAPEGENAIAFGDWNGDGRTDLLLGEGNTNGPYSCGNSSAHLYLANASGIMTYASTFQYSGTKVDNIHVGDWNGDGRNDIAIKGSWSCIVYSGEYDVWGSGSYSPVFYQSAGSSMFATYTSPINADIQAVGDWNGDGLSDFAQGTMFLSLGNGSFASTGSSLPGNPRAVGDWNGDGKTDVAYDHCSLYQSNGVSMVHMGNFCQGYGLLAAGDWNGDGGGDIWRSDSPTIQYRTGFAPDLVTTITTGLGATTGVTYKPITDASVHVKDSGAAYPTIDLAAPVYVVSQVNASNGIGGNRTVNYTYAGAKANAHGRGFLGFRQVTATDTGTGISTTANYRQDFPYIGLLSSREKRASGGTLLNRLTNTFDATALGGTRHFVYLTQGVDESYELNGNLVASLTTANAFDAFGNATQIIATSNDGHVKTTVNTYTNDTANWILGRLTRATVTSRLPDTSAATRTSSFAYDAASGLLTQEVIEPDQQTLRLTTDYTYDAYGNKTAATVSGSGIVTRTTTTAFGAQGRFPVTATNALGHVETRAFDSRFGGVTSLTGPNGLVTTWAYDGFGRKTRETRADGTQSNWAYEPCGCSPQEYHVTLTATGQPTKRTHFDMLNREVETQVQAFDGAAWVVRETEYDGLGRVARVSRPYITGPPQWTSFAYDILGRVTSETAPDTTVTATTYAGLSTTVTQPLGRTRSILKNSQGQTVRVTDALGAHTTYAYDHFGNLVQVTDPAGNRILAAYDLRGRRIVLDDPDTGRSDFAYNVLGELTGRSDAKGQLTTFAYDKLGRMVERIEPDLTSTWTYDTAVKGVGKLAAATASNGYMRQHLYDSLGRPAATLLTVDDPIPNRFDTLYDANGRVSEIAYPSGFGARHVYTAQGYLKEVRDRATDALYWRADTRDAEGQLTQFTYGNGVATTQGFHAQTGRLTGITAGPVGAVQALMFSYDALGNLTDRVENGLSEAFTYDALNRLTSAQIAGQPAKTYQYDSIGNIVSKSDVGTYSYPLPGAARPHAVSATMGAVNASYSYDANGNLTSGGGRTVSWTSYNLPAQITRGGASVVFTHDVDHQRVKQTVGLQATVYLSDPASGVRAEKLTGGGAVEWRNYIFAAGENVAIRHQLGAGAFTRYLHKDHLGSVRAITDDAGLVSERLAYDSWGKRRNLDGTDDPGEFAGSIIDRGYTGHEHLEEVGLIHMNGRVYDPRLARFMSADPILQSLFDTQGLNRFSYTGNNPLAFTDPSGHLRIGRLFRAVAAIAVAWALGPIGPAALVTEAAAGSAVAAALANSAIGGFAGGIVGGGDLEGGFIGAATAAAFYGVGSATGAHFGTGPEAAVKANEFFLKAEHFANIAGHAAVGCASAAASGSKCGAGAFAAAAGAAVGPKLVGMHVAAQTAISATIGGTASVIGGGKFENGAITAAFGHLFNEVALACRGVSGSGGAASHCGLFVFQGTDTKTAGIDAQFSLAGGATEFTNDTSTYEADLEAFRRGTNVYIISPPAGVPQVAWDTAVIRAASSYRATNYDAILGPNSNSAATYPIIVNGGQVPNIREGWLFGPRGIDYWQKPQNWPLP
jgi:RHS repeat-associated protein